MLLRNLDPPRLSNGTRLVVQILLTNVIKATILTGSFKGEDVVLPLIPIISTDSVFEFRRLQFPIRLSFAISIIKAQVRLPVYAHRIPALLETLVRRNGIYTVANSCCCVSRARTKTWGDTGRKNLDYDFSSEIEGRVYAILAFSFLSFLSWVRPSNTISASHIFTYII